MRSMSSLEKVRFRKSPRADVRDNVGSDSNDLRAFAHSRVAESRRRQGFPPTIENDATLATVARLMTMGSNAPADAASISNQVVNAPGIKARHTTTRRRNDDVLDHGRQERAAAVQAPSLPGAA